MSTSRLGRRGRGRGAGRAAATLILLATGALAPTAPAAGQESVPGSLPLDVALSLQGHNARSPVNVSPDGAWVAHTVETDETVPRGASYAYAETGFPFAEGDARMRVTLSPLGSGEEIRLGDPGASSWGAVWSPDGERVAFYSDEGGEAGLWVWERSSGETRRVTDRIVRPFFGFETARWSGDGRRLLVKLLPAGTTLPEANAYLPAPAAEPAAPPADPDEPSVSVRLSAAAAEARAGRPDAGAGGDTLDAIPADDPIARRLRGFSADLVLVDVETGEVRTLVAETPVRTYALSPDGRHVGYTVQAGAEPNAQQTLFDLRVHDLDTGSDRLLAERIRLGYGSEWGFSPDGDRIAYTESGQTAEGGFVVIGLADGAARALENDAPSLAPGEGEIPPLWSPDGRTLFAVTEGGLWSVDAGTGEAREHARIDGWEIRSLVTATFGSPLVWSLDGGATVWVVARESAGRRAGIHAVDVRTGTTRPVLQETRSYGYVFSQAASAAGGAIVFVARDQQHLDELWALDVASGDVRQVSRINESLGRYALGEARVIRWRGADGDSLAGALLLPPGYERGRRLPLVVWVYGGNHGSASVDRFGLWGSMATFNMHVLATRGYAVLFPDAPVRTGRITEDLVATVLPGVDAAVEQGWADPERLAIMGQSYGSINVLALLTRTTRFRAAVITAAVLHPDLFAAYLTETGYYERGQGNMGGTIWEHPERYRANSPLFDFPAIETPLLIGQGDLDGDLAPSEAIFTALDRLGKSVEYRVYRGESHVISRRANVIDFWTRRLAFLAEHLDLSVTADGAARADGRPARRLPP
jgi:dipeptidyl aminopeptidase/acylaminoacyl peptidase